MATVWRFAPAARAPPLTILILFAMCEWALQKRCFSLGTALYVGFHCILRFCAILNLTRSDVRLLPDCRSGVANWGLTESGQRAGVRESVQIDCPLVCRMLAVRCTTTQSLRRGGATHFFQKKTGSLSTTTVRGRWAHQKGRTLH